ncbi:MAG: helicase SNF2, partial [Planctomycetaceae bacterium]
MSLAHAFESQFRGDIRFRGQAYFKTDRVSIARIEADRIESVVSDGAEFHTVVERQEGHLRLACSCWPPERANPSCKHLWATLLKVDADGVIPGPIVQGAIPPFGLETLPPLAPEDYWDTESSRDVYVPPPPLARGARSAGAAPVLKPWEQKLQTLSERLHSEVIQASVTPRDREIFYEIDPLASRERRALVLQVMQRQRRSNGQWGKFKPLRIKSGRLEEIDNDQDRRLLAQLVGVSMDRSIWHAPVGPDQGQQPKFQVALDLALVLVPELCATGRLRLAGTTSEKAEGPVFDDAGGWELSLDVAPDEAEDCWQVRGQLQRNDERRSLADARLLLPGGLVVFAECVARFHDGGTFGWTDLLATDRPLKVPREDGEALVDRLLDMPQLPRLALPEELRLDEIQVAPRPHLTLFTPRGVRWQHERLTGEVEFEYDGSRVRGTSPQGAIVQREQGRCLARDRAVEERHWEELTALGVKRLAHAYPARRDIEIPSKSLGGVVRGLMKSGWELHADGRQMHQAGPLSFE